MTEFLSRSAEAELAGLFLTVVVLSLTTAWRLRFATLAVQYLLAAALITPLVIWQVAAAKALVGLMVVLILTLSGRAARAAPAPALAEPAGRLALLRRIEFQTNLPFRVLAGLLTTVAAWYLATVGGYALADLPATVNLAGYLLILLGLLNLGLTEEPVNAGIGLLMFLNGFEIMYAPIERSLTVAALLAAVNLGVALAVSHLALLRYGAPDEGA